MLFTFIIPHYSSQTLDRRPMLDELMESMLDEEGIEVVVVDDHSEVKWEPKRKFTQTTLRILQNLPDQKYAGTARNLGLSVARGEFIFFADDDDRYITENLQKLCEQIKIEGSVVKDVTIFRATSFYTNGKIGTRHQYIDRHIEEYLKEGTPLLNRLHSPWTKVIKRKFIEEYGLEFGDTKFANDVLFAVKLANYNPTFSVFDAIVYNARQGNKGLTAEESLENIETRIKVVGEASVFLKEIGNTDLSAPIAMRYVNEFLQNPVRIGNAFIKAHKAGAYVFPGPSYFFLRLRRKLTNIRSKYFGGKDEF